MSISDSEQKFAFALVQLGGESDGQKCGEGRPRSLLTPYPYMCGLVRNGYYKGRQGRCRKGKWLGEMWNEKMSLGEVGCG